MSDTLRRISIILTVIGLVLPVFPNLMAQMNQPPGQRGSRDRDAYGTGIAEDVIFSYDPETGSLIVIADEETNFHIKQIIQNLDRPAPQVLIRVLFLEITHSNKLDIGTEGSITYGSEGTEDIIETIFGLADQSLGGFYRILDEDLEVTIRALAEVAKLEVLSRPSILARNNEEATIIIGQEVPFIRNSRVTSDGQIINTVEYEDIGIILQVTPRITSERLVEMLVMPEISTLTGETVPVSAGVDAPVIAKRSAETRVVVPDGKTVVIGGLIQDQLIETTRKVPFFGDIPLLGYAFKRSIKEKSKTELLIFLTPSVLQGPADLATVSDLEKKELELTPQVFTEKQIQKYMREHEQE